MKKKLSLIADIRISWKNNYAGRFFYLILSSLSKFNNTNIIFIDKISHIGSPPPPPSCNTKDEKEDCYLAILQVCIVLCLKGWESGEAYGMFSQVPCFLILVQILFPLAFVLCSHGIITFVYNRLMGIGLSISVSHRPNSARGRTGSVQRICLNIIDCFKNQSP